MKSTTLLISGGDGGGYWAGLIVPAAIFLLGAVFSAGILAATRRRQDVYDSEQDQEQSQLEKDRQILSKIYWLLDRDLAEEDFPRTLDELLHYAWLLGHDTHRDLARRIRDFDRDKLANPAEARAELQRIKDETKLYLS